MKYQHYILDTYILIIIMNTNKTSHYDPSIKCNHLYDDTPVNYNVTELVVMGLCMTLLFVILVPLLVNLNI